MAFIPLNILYTSQTDFEDSANTSININTSSQPGTIFLTKTSQTNAQALDSNNNFRGTITADLEISSGKIKIKPSTSRFMNVVPPRTKTTTEDYLSLAFNPIDSNSLTLRADGLKLTANIDYLVNSTTGRVDLLSSFSSSTTFEASYLSYGILACEGEYESEPISIGDDATELSISLQGVNVNSLQIMAKFSNTILGLSTASYASYTSPIPLASSDKFIQLKLTFIPTSFIATVFPVTFKNEDDWNLPGSTFTNVNLNVQKRIEITSLTNNTTGVSSLPEPLAVTGADYFKDPFTDDLFLIQAGGYKNTTTLSSEVRIAKIKPDHTLENWILTKPLPEKAEPYNGVKTVTINGVSFVYVLNNNSSKNVYKSKINYSGVTAWSTLAPLPKNIHRGNLEIISNPSTNDHFVLIHNNEFIYWAKINNFTGNIENWETFVLPEKQRAGGSAIFASTTDGTFYWYLLGGVLGSSVQKINTNLVTKVTITQAGGNLSFNSQQASQILPQSLSHFTAEYVPLTSGNFIYTFGGTTESDIFGNGAVDKIYRAEVDQSTGDLLSVFQESPNKLFDQSCTHNTVLVTENGSACAYTLGDGERTSTRVSCINIIEASSSTRQGTYRTGVFEIPGCNVTFGQLVFNKTLRNNNQFINAYFRVAENLSDINSVPFIQIQDQDNIPASLNDKYIQFEFILSKDPTGSINELSPILHDFTFIFTSNISGLTETPELSSINLNCDNTAYSNSGEILLRYDSFDINTSYTNFVIDQDPIKLDESLDIQYRVGDTFPLASAFLPLSDFFTSSVVGRFIEIKLLFNPSSDALFSPKVNSVEISGLTSEEIGGETGEFVFNQQPTGDQDGINTHFTLPKDFASGTLRVFVNGMEQAPGISFSEGVDQISFDFIGYAPDPLDVIRCHYIEQL